MTPDIQELKATALIDKKYSFLRAYPADTILALIEENERLREALKAVWDAYDPYENKSDYMTEIVRAALEGVKK